MFQQCSNPPKSKRWLKIIVLFIIVACRFWMNECMNATKRNVKEAKTSLRL